MEDSEDLHVCLKCNGKIHGLENYIKHRQTNCQVKTGNDTKPTPLKLKKADTDTGSSRLDDTIPVQQGEDGLPDIAVEKPKQKRKRGRPRRIIREDEDKDISRESEPVSREIRKVMLHQSPVDLSVSRASNKQGNGETSVVGATRTRRNKKPRRIYEDFTDEEDEDGEPNLKVYKSVQGKESVLKRKSSKRGRAKKPLAPEEELAIEKAREENRYNCKPCNFSSLSTTSLLQHLKTTKHTEHLANAEGENIATFVCNTCPSSFFTESGLAHHKIRHQQQGRCGKCGLEFETRADLVTHRKVKHNAEEGRQGSAETCEMCGKKFSRGYMKIHRRVHSGEKPFSCDTCPFKSNQKGDLLMHKKRHLGIKDRKCPQCDFITLRSSILKNHILTHTKREKTEECPTCHLKFYNKNLLRSHVYMKHVLARVHQCTYVDCTYKFKYKIELVAHMRSHTKEKPFLCTVCGYSGATKQALTRHFRKHTGDKPFKCDFPDCSYMGRVSTHLTRHKRLHTGEKPYKCPYCNYRANTHENVRKHIRCTKKHAGLSVYMCKFCKDMQTDRYQELVDHVRQAHTEHYLTFDKVSHQSGLLAEKEEFQTVEKDDEQEPLPAAFTVNPDRGINCDLQIDIPNRDVESNHQITVPTPMGNCDIAASTSGVNPDLQIAVPTSEVNSDLQIAVPSSERNQEYILCQVVQEGNDEHPQEAEGGTKEADQGVQGAERMQEIQMVTVEGQASQALEMLLRHANGSHGSQDFIII